MKTPQGLFCSLVATLVLSCLFETPVLAQIEIDGTQGEVSADDVRQSVDRAIAYLKREQKPRGNWRAYGGQNGGVTALCTLAMLEAGVPADDPKIALALDYLRTVEPEKTYTVSLQTMVFARATPKRDNPLIARNVRWLERTQVSEGDMRGSWSYSGGGRIGDPSNAQFAILALYEAERAGVDVNSTTWRMALGYWQRRPRFQGAWNYRGGSPFTGSMTCAAIASIVIAQGQTTAGDARISGGKVLCCQPHQQDDLVEEGLRWLGNHFQVELNPTSGNREDANVQQIWHRYYLYGVERVGRITGRRFFVGKKGKYDWYREGATYLVNNQNKLNGHWIGAGFGENHYAEKNPLIATSLSLLFLAKGKRPVVVAKLQRPGDDWNRHRGDIAHLADYAARKWKIPLTWQVIDSTVATTDDYLQAPVVFLNGRDSFEMDDVQKEALRDYIQQGGFVFAESCCKGEAFDESFTALMKDLFPDYGLKELTPDHPIWTMEEKVDPEYLRPLWGIDVGCRTSVVYCPGNLSCYWELDTARERDDIPAKIRDEIVACRAIGINVLAYATGRQLKDKEIKPPTAQIAADTETSIRSHLAIAKIRHNGGCDAAPRALANFLETVADEFQIRTVAEPPLLNLTDPALFQHHMLFMHGRYDFRLSAKEREQLKTFVERGGIVLSDSICASSPFSRAFRREMAEIWPEKDLARIPTHHALFSEAYGGANLEKVTRREPGKRRQGEPLELKLKQVEPELEGILFDERYGVIFSKYDLSCALQRQQAPQCVGYTPEDASRIAINVLLYSLYE